MQGMAIVNGRGGGFGRRCACGAYVQAMTWAQLLVEWQRHAARCEGKQ